MGRRCLLLLLLLGTVVVPAASEQERPAEGTVVEVRGEKAKIALEEGNSARIGYQVEIYTSDAQLAGFWLVTEARGSVLTAVKVEGLTPPQVGWKAKVYDASTVAQPLSQPPWAKETERSDSDQPDLDKIFGPPPPGAFVSTKGYLVKRDDGSFQEGFDNFRRWAAGRGPSREIMAQAYEKWKTGPAQVPFLGLWVENNESVLSQTYAMAPVGLIVTGVCPGAAADRAGLRVGDIILKVNGEFVRHPLVLSETAGKLVLEVERDSKLLQITLEAEFHD